ncbi:MAG: GatB/YqeY domain-containing protein [Patescibacteria group bacterium]
MTLFEKLTQDQIAARKSRDEGRLSIIQVVLSAVKYERIGKNRELTDEEAQAVIAKQVKQLKDALHDFESAGRADLIEKSRNEIAILEAYLPEQMSNAELQKVIEAIGSQLAITGAPSDAGKVIGRVMAEVKGKADGGKVKVLVAEYLAGKQN